MNLVSLANCSGFSISFCPGTVNALTKQLLLMFTTAKRHHFIAHTRTVTMSFKPNGAVKLSKCRYFQLLSISVLHCFEISLLIFWFNSNFGCNAIFKKMFHCTILSLNFFFWGDHFKFGFLIKFFEWTNRIVWDIK